MYFTIIILKSCNHMLQCNAICTLHFQAGHMRVTSSPVLTKVKLKGLVVKPAGVIPLTQSR